MRPRPGDVVAERFEVETLVGAGGMGSVFRARDRHTGEPVAVKLMREHGEGASARFLLEARVLAELRHPGIVRYIAHGATPAGELYLAMEWLEGVSLAEKLESGPLGVSEAVILATRVADALAAAHARGVVHRDVKPTNLFLPGGAIERVKVLDFGVARLGQALNAQTRDGGRVGTPRYMAPEQVRGDRDIDARVDVFALGCVLYVALSGHHAFGGHDEREIFNRILNEEPQELALSRPDAPPGLTLLVKRMLAKEPSQRPSDAAAVTGELQELSTETFTTGGTPAPADLEQRLLSVVLVGGTPRPEARETAHRYGAQLEELPSGAVAFLLSGARSAGDQAARGARLALELAKIVPGPVALATGRGVLSRRQLAGDVMDRAAALLRSGSQGVMLDDVTAGLLDAGFEVRDGALVGETGSADPHRTLLGRPTPFVGRDRELGMIEAVWRECVADGVARVVLVTGSPGMGKSRLRRELTQRLRDASPDGRFFLARGDPMRAGSPFSLIAPAVRTAADIAEGAPPETSERRLRQRVAATVPTREADRVAMFLGELVGVPFAGHGDVQLNAARDDAILMGDQMRRAFEDFIAAEAARGPVMLCLEDVHNGDLPSVKFVDAALRNASGPLLVLALARPDVHAMFPGLWAERALTEIRLGELSRRAGDSLVRAVLGDVAPSVVARLLDRAGGNVLYLEELIRAVAEGQAERLPETVLAMVQSRIEAFPAEARRVLRAGSVFGETFWLGGAAAVLAEQGVNEESLREWIGVLCDKEVLSQRPTRRHGGGEVEITFRHALVREAAYASWTDADRQRAQRTAGAWLESWGEGDAMLLAACFERGGEPRRAVVWYHRAAEQAFEGNDFAAAITRAHMGIACGASGPMEGALRMIASEAYRWRGQNVDVLREARAAMACLTPGDPAWCTAAGGLAVTSGKIGETATLLELVDQIQAIAGRPTGAVAAAAAKLYTSLRILGLSEGAEKLWPMLQLDAAARLRFGPAVVARVEVARSVNAASAGDVGAFLRLCESAVGGFEHAGDLRGALGPRVNLGFALTELGSFASAERVLRETLQTSQRIGIGSVTSSAKQNLGLALARLGRLDEARRIEADAVSDYHTQGARYYEGAARLYLGRILGSAGDLEGARAELTKAIEQLAVAPPMRCYATAAMAEVLLRAGNVKEALASARAAMAALVELGEINEGESVVRLVHAKALGAAGLVDEAAAALAAARERLRQRAAKISDRDMRRQFLEVVPENAATMNGG